MNEAELSANVTFTYIVTNRWLGFRFDLAICTLSLVAAICCVAFKGAIDAELLTFSLQILTDVTIYFSISARYLTEMQNFMTSAQAIHRYTQLDQEDALSKPKDAELLAEAKKEVAKKDTSSLVAERKTWPVHGQIEFDNVEMRYRETLEPSISNLHFSV